MIHRKPLAKAMILASFAMLSASFCLADASGQAATTTETPDRSTCKSRFEDRTSPELQRFLAGLTLRPIGTPTVKYTSKGKKIASQLFVVEGAEGNQIVIEQRCESSCSPCGIEGCDLTGSGGCSGCTCSGSGCPTCDCTKIVEQQ